MSDSTRKISVLEIRPESHTPAERIIPIEAPVSIEFNGIGYAVMMATPNNLEDFVTGFALSERIVEDAKNIREISTHETPKGWIARAQISRDLMKPMLDRVRTRVSESSCGLCGLENLDQLSRPLPVLKQSKEVSDEAIFKALDSLRRYQPLNKVTGGVHAAAFCSQTGDILEAREDVGRHNALDKLIGARARSGDSMSDGFILLSSRCSYELVEKTIVAGCPLLVTISTATSLAAARAEESKLRLIVLARQDAALEIR